MASSRRRKPKSFRDAFGLASQAEMYLHRALDEFHRSCNAPDLWIPVDPFHRGSIFEEPQKILNAQNRRVQLLRSSVLFSAISAEAFANELLDDLLGSAELEALDKLATPDKLLVGVPLATGDHSGPHTWCTSNAGGEHLVQDPE